MIIPLLYVLLGWMLLFTVLTEVHFHEIGVARTLFERLVFVLAWPAFLTVMLLWRFCRGDEDEGQAIV